MRNFISDNFVFHCFKTVLLCALLVFSSSSISGSSSDLMDVTRKLPWEFVEDRTYSPGQEGNALVGMNVLNSTVLVTREQVDVDGTAKSYLRIRYHMGSTDSEPLAYAAYKDLLRDLDGQERQDWVIVLQAGKSLHWLGAACPLPRDNLRQVYAGLIDYVEARGVPTQRGIQCSCASQCIDVAINR